MKQENNMKQEPKPTILDTSCFDSVNNGFLAANSADEDAFLILCARIQSGTLNEHRILDLNRSNVHHA